MKRIRILSLLLALLTVASLLCACNDEEGAEGGSKNAPATNLSVIVNGETDFVVVYDNDASDELVAAILALTESIQKNIGAEMTLQPCFMDREDETDVRHPNEILIGMTNRQESIDMLGSMRSKDFTITAKNGKLIVGGGGDEGTLFAITRFINDFVVKQGNLYAVKQGDKQNLIFSSDKAVNEAGSYSYTTAHLMGVSLDQFAIVYPKNDTSGEALANKISTHISAQTGYALPVLRDSTKWADYEIRVGAPNGNADKHTPKDGCLCNTLAANEYYIKLVKTQVTYEDGSIHDGARLYVCFGGSSTDAALKAFTEEIMPTLSESKPFTLEEGVIFTNRASK